MRFVSLFLYSCVLPAVAQLVHRVPITIELSRPAEGLRAEVLTLTHQEVIAAADIAIASSFEIRDVPAGQYLLRLTNRWGEAVKEFVVSAPAFTPIRVVLPALAEPQGPISWRRLRHKAPKEARRLLKRARAERDAGRLTQATQLYRQARETDAGFFEAIFEAGLLALRVRDLPLATALFDQAEQIDAGFAPLLTHRGIAEYAQGRVQPALDYARRALRFAPGDRRAHYLAALALHAMRQTGPEQAEHLRAAAPDYPQAARMLRELSP